MLVSLSQLFLFVLINMLSTLSQLFLKSRVNYGELKAMKLHTSASLCDLVRLYVIVFFDQKKDFLLLLFFFVFVLLLPLCRHSSGMLDTGFEWVHLGEGRVFSPLFHFGATPYASFTTDFRAYFVVRLFLYIKTEVMEGNNPIKAFVFAKKTIKPFS